MRDNLVRLARSVSVAGLLLFGAALPLGAQVVFGNLIGTVTDPSGSAIPNARVTITDLDKNVVTEVTTNESGNFSKGQLTAGNYKLEIEAAGFKKGLVAGVAVSVDTTQRVDVRLEVGNVTEQIEVTAEAPLIKSDRSDVATIFNTQQLTNLPSFDRNFQSYQLLTQAPSAFPGSTLPRRTLRAPFKSR